MKETYTDNNRVNVPKELHTVNISYLLNYAICVYTATKQLHNFPFSFPHHWWQGKYHCMQHMSLGVNTGLQWIMSLQFTLNYALLLIGKEPTAMARKMILLIQGGSKMTGTDLCVNKPVTVPVIFEPPCTFMDITHREDPMWRPLCVHDHINKTSFKKPTRYFLDCYQAAISTGTGKKRPYKGSGQPSLPHRIVIFQLLVFFPLYCSYLSCKIWIFATDLMNSLQHVLSHL